MANKFCTRCNAEVEDTGGYCLLGHRLGDAAPGDSLTALRAEVNRTFDEARQQLADVMAPAAAVAPVIVTPPERMTRPAAVPELAARPSRFVPPPPTVELDDHLEVHAEGPRLEAFDADAPPAHHHSVWDELDDAPLAPGDPIASFAPEPRMDWGPRKARFIRKRPRSGQLQPEG
jgi:hypothetical protein